MTARTISIALCVMDASHLCLSTFIVVMVVTQRAPAWLWILLLANSAGWWFFRWWRRQDFRGLVRRAREREKEAKGLS